MISTQTRQTLMPNSMKTVLFAALAFASASTFAGDLKKAEKIGELKDVKKAETTLKADEMSASLDTQKKAELKSEKKQKKEMESKATELKAEAPER